MAKIPTGTKFSSEDELRQHVKTRPELTGIRVVTFLLPGNELQVHDSTHDKLIAESMLDKAQAVAEQLNHKFRPKIYCFC